MYTSSVVQKVRCLYFHLVTFLSHNECQQNIRMSRRQQIMSTGFTNPPWMVAK